MNNDVSSETLSELLSLKRKLQTISDISFAFSNLKQQSPLNNLTEQSALKLIEQFRSLLEEAKATITKIV